MIKLTNNQKKILRSKGHTLKPVIIVGQHGLSESVLVELKAIMEKHELLKIKIRIDERERKQKIIDKIIDTSNAHLVQIIGNIVVIYRGFDEEPQIILPRQ
ncbi:ribosome assembly RNA-binding protein YhbY [Candidatus Ruthia endofausta]|uniref:Ribosome assembly RNA-binding protein YhbY n=1 Tax=Candidatus Ruthia endofausta TaxID=2738852 RepID=A0A6N0HR39_9GAMM|nr:ribosome assembly RNA-binding protein YhbY [Candidatus Ruthia endofausta]QKQ24700.1 ribosome assembly RNA-binding protein YhbY [Candidatus Ruthia endofausta]